MLKRLLAMLVLAAALAAGCGPATNPNGSGGLDGLGTPMQTPVDGLQTELPMETPAT